MNFGIRTDSTAVLPGGRGIVVFAKTDIFPYSPSYPAIALTFPWRIRIMPSAILGESSLASSSRDALSKILNSVPNFGNSIEIFFFRSS